MKTLLKTLYGAAVSAALLVGSAVSFGAERIVVVGDSITGHSMNLPYGFTHEIRAALADAHNDAARRLILGGIIFTATSHKKKRRECY